MPGRTEYAALVARVEAFGATAHEAQRPWLRCARGCDACCRTRRSAWAVEIDALRTHLTTLSEARRAELADRRESPEVRAGRRCVYLDADGGCAVYSARPLLCRTHGPAVRSAEAGLLWCELNFPGMPAESVAAQVDASTVLDLDRLNQLLALINQRYCATRAVAPRADLAAALGPEGETSP